jgi:hypothetical protein
LGTSSSGAGKLRVLFVCNRLSGGDVEGWRELFRLPSLEHISHYGDMDERNFCQRKSRDVGFSAK